MPGEPRDDAADEASEVGRGPRVRARARRRRAEAAVAAGLLVATAYGFVALPLRAWLLGVDPALLAVVIGSRPALVAVGARAAVGQGPWLWPLLLGTLSIVKFHWVFWWAGRLWGEVALTRIAGDTPRARRRIDRAERVVRRWRTPAVALTYAPVPLAKDLVVVALGTAGGRFRTFFAIDLTVAFLTQSMCVALGAVLGESAVSIVAEYARFAGPIALVALGLMTLAALRAFVRSRRLSRRRTR